MDARGLILLTELGDLKRIRSAGVQASLATRLFQDAWRAVGGSNEDVWAAITGRALAAARLGDLPLVLDAAGLSTCEQSALMAAAIDSVAHMVPADARRRFASVASRRSTEHRAAELPPFVAALARQPRAGITAPGRARIVLEPPENHAEHCLMVAVYGVLLAPAYGADERTVFLAGLAHHFHNAGMPDAGFTGEVLLGRHLGPVMDHFTEACFAQLAPPVAARVREARTILVDAGTPEGRAFHAADVIDRVLQVRQHLRAASLSMATILDDMQLVHDGPVKPFHDQVLREIGLA